MPSAVTLNVAESGDATETEFGWVMMRGAYCTVRVTVLLVADPCEFVAMTRNWAPLSDGLVEAKV